MGDDRSNVDRLSIAASVVILTKNEEKHVERAIKSAKQFAEVLVVDSHSEDATVEIASSNGAKIVSFEWDGQYPKKKEWALQHVSHDWVIYLDADEFFTETLVTEIAGVIAQDSASAIEVPLRYYWLGTELQHGHQVKKRIAMRTSRCYWPRPNDLHVENMWEVEGHYQPQVRRGAVHATLNKLGHSDEDGLYEYFARHNRYSDWEAHMLVSHDVASLQSRSAQGRLAAKLPGKPLIFFLYSYVLKTGFLDGRAGLSYAMALSFYYWQIELKVRELELKQGSMPESFGTPAE